MSAVSLAIIGKANEPLYLRDFLGEENSVDDAALFGLPLPKDETDVASAAPRSDSLISLRQEFILHAALDRFVQVNGPPPGFGWRNASSPTTVTTTGTTTSSPDPQFVGMLGPWDDLHVYGWMSTTHIKFLVALRDDGGSTHYNKNVSTLLRHIHQLYVEYRLNPLGPLTGPIQSKAFDRKIQQTVETYNQRGSL
jgi:hypothetical protein